MFNLNINFISHKQILNFNNVDVYFNFDQTDEWIKLENDYILGYDIILLKIIIDSYKEKYLFVKNADVIIRNNQISITTFSDIEFFIKTNIKKQYDKQIKNINYRITALQAMQKIGLDFDLLLELRLLKQEQYILKMKNTLKLKKE